MNGLEELTNAPVVFEGDEGVGKVAKAGSKKPSDRASTSKKNNKKKGGNQSYMDNSKLFTMDSTIGLEPHVSRSNRDNEVFVFGNFASSGQTLVTPIEEVCMNRMEMELTSEEGGSKTSSLQHPVK